jgi:hypothetical protein
MHTVSELGHSGDVFGTIAVLHQLFARLAADKVNGQTLRTGHPRLDHASSEQLTTK